MNDKANFSSSYVLKSCVCSTTSRAPPRRFSDVERSRFDLNALAGEGMAFTIYDGESVQQYVDMIDKDEITEVPQAMQE